jgi:phenylpropionate dioxygenase-like ring-hydroxylating dioxygenase large terminal subunit
MDVAQAGALAGQRGMGGALREYWHPVATADQVTNGPLPVRLLDVPLVLWRSQAGIAAFYDLCIHRGTPLSLGEVRDDRLVCGYHGWNYDSSGACTLIPSLPPERGIPSKARATAYRCVERYGLVWVCLGEPRAEIPLFPTQIGDPTFRWETRRPQPLRANAARFIENNMDQSHFAFVHTGILAVDPQVEPIEIVPLDDGFTYEVVNPTNTLIAGGPQESTTFRLIIPFTLLIVKATPGGPERNVLVFVGSPVSGREATVFRLAARNFVRFSDEDERERQRTIFEQDRAIVEAQRPEELPLDLREELHLRGPDSAALEYRRMLGRIGVDWG